MDEYTLEFECMKCGWIELAEIYAMVTCCGESMVEVGE